MVHLSKPGNQHRYIIKKTQDFTLTNKIFQQRELCKNHNIKALLDLNLKKMTSILERRGLGVKDARGRMMTSTQDGHWDELLKFVQKALLYEDFPNLMPVVFSLEDKPSQHFVLHCLGLIITHMLAEKKKRDVSIQDTVIIASPATLLATHHSLLANVLFKSISESFTHEEFTLGPLPFEFLKGRYVPLKIYSFGIIIDNTS